MKVSKAFKVFNEEAKSISTPYSKMVDDISEASALDKKTKHLSYLAVLASNRLHSGLEFHVFLAKQAGASRDEVISAILIGLPAVGIRVSEALPIALEAYDQIK